MPIYEYRCGACGATVEVLVRSSENTPTCPHCGAILSEKLLSAAHVTSGRATPEGGRTCCGREERCDSAPCAAEGACCRG